MKIVQGLTQGSIEWLNWRKQGIGGSDVAVIMGLSPFKKITDLWLEKTGQKEEEDLSGNFIVQRGHALEPEAREAFEKLSGCEFPAAIFQSDEMDFLKFSCDGYNGKNQIIEIKCNGNKSHELAIKGQIPDYYMAQIQYGMLVSKTSSCHYISYNPDHHSPLVTFEIKQDKELQNNILDKVISFWQINVIGKEVPSSVRNDLFEIKDEDIKQMILDYKHHKSIANTHLEAAEDLEKEIKDYLNKNNVSKTNYSGVNFLSVKRQGNVDYSQIPELKGVDLEKYRKKASSYYKITIED